MGTVRDESKKNDDTEMEDDNNSLAQIDEMQKDRVAALNQSLVRNIIETDDDKVELDNISIGTEDPSKVEEAREEAAKVKNLQSLFKNMKFFLSREIPREPLVFMIRSFGGEVSWDNTAAPGSTYQVDDTSVTHQICDRPRDSIDMKHINRFYVQPQWIFDSINRRELLEMHKYFVGEPLPPHLSPFISEERRIGDYMPPEEEELLGLIEKSEQKEAANDEDVEEEESDDDASEEEEGEEEEENASDDEKAENDAKNINVQDMKVEQGKPEKVDKSAVQKNMEEEEYKLRVLMMKKKHKGLYKSMMKSRKRRVNESKNLERKRTMHDEAAKATSGTKAKKSKK